MNNEVNKRIKLEYLTMISGSLMNSLCQTINVHLFCNIVRAQEEVYVPLV